MNSNLCKAWRKRQPKDAQGKSFEILLNMVRDTYRHNEQIKDRRVSGLFNL